MNLGSRPFRSHLFRTNLFRVTVWLATTSLSITGIAPAWAQQAAPDDAAPPNGAAPNGADPPALAGRLAALSGTVSTHAAGQTDWTPAILNTPVTTGDSFWTQPQSSATIEVGGDHFVLNEATELDVAQLDQAQFVGTAAQGEIFLSLPELPSGAGFTVNTPRGAVQITAAGQYDIIAGDTATPTIVTVIAGAAQVTSTGMNLTVAANQAATITGTDQLAGNVGPAAPDEFLRAQLHGAAPPALPPSVPQQVRNMTGGADLAQYGNWQATPDYGQVWYPRNVPADWAPYRDGRWSYVGPWGWTWVDQEPWGFAPFHYGRWVSYGGRWGWVAAAHDAPADDYPVYAPALVAFVGGGALAGVALGFGGGEWGGGGVGWVPLGFGEPFRPWYHVSDRYFQNVNRVSVVNVNNYRVNNFRNVTINHYANARGATVVPAGVIMRGEPLRGIARPLPAAALARAEPVVGRLPVRPSALTPGLTRNEARRYNVALPARPVGPRAPGPVVRPGGGLSRPALRPAVAGAHPFVQRPPGSSGPRQGLAPAAAPGGAPPGIVHPGIVHPGIVHPGIVHPGVGRPGAAAPGLPPLRPAGEAHSRPAALPPAGARRGPETMPHPEIPHTAPARPAPARPTPARPGPAAPARPAVPHAVRPAVPAPAHLLERPATPRAAPQLHPAPRPAPAFHPAPAPAHLPERAAAPRPAPAPRPTPEFHPAAPRPAPPHPDDKHPK